ncbi:hypothetical protein Bb109J_c1938 [Bdellovibrio bacteriovorus]|uniref:BrnT family toxin n=1 Tax=Bdellovibrio bacteriovorus TaxID=959 RepID=UPI00045C0D11|nr:hypothetical protein EP01_06715 [Bdellovibrio bacteriovorus]BEV68518.1 hypothetical protein Bb109J_c1938 [Bdellovibrio bacteriovorus]
MSTFQWDDKKSESNRKKHGVTFEEASTIFLGPYLEVADDSSDEERFKAIGISRKSKVLVVVYCYREEDKIRIISARKATKHEKENYEEKK